MLDVPKGEWELIEPADLEAAGEVRPGDIVVINTGWHRRYSDSMDYFGHGPGLSGVAARWLVDREVKLVGIDTATIDHPMATSLASHRGGPIVKELPRRYAQRSPAATPAPDFPDWNPPHKMLLAGGHPDDRERRRRRRRRLRQAGALPCVSVVLAGRRRLRGPADRDPRPRRRLPAREWMRDE